MKKLTRKLFISILSMAFAVIAIGTTTFAWITISNTATVDAFTGTVEAGTAGLEVSLDGSSWTSRINLTSLIDQTKINLSDITTVDGKAFYELGVTGNKGSTTSISATKGSSEESSKAAGKYIEVEFYIRRSDWETAATGAAPIEVYVDSSKVSFSTTSSGDFVTDVEVGNYGVGDTVEGIQVDHAARLSVTATNTVIYEKAASTTNTTGTDYDGFACDYWTAKLGGELTYEDNAVKAGYKTFKAGTANPSTSIAQLEAGEAGKTGVKVTIRVWVEGFDNECHSNILKQTLTVALGFTISGNPATAD